MGADCFCGKANTKTKMLQCQVCEKRIHYACVAVIDDEDAKKKRPTFACPSCHRKSIEKTGKERSSTNATVRKHKSTTKATAKAAKGINDQADSDDQHDDDDRDDADSDDDVSDEVEDNDGVDDDDSRSDSDDHRKPCEQNELKDASEAKADQPYIATKSDLEKAMEKVANRARKDANKAAKKQLAAMSAIIEKQNRTIDELREQQRRFQKIAIKSEKPKRSEPPVRKTKTASTPKKMSKHQGRGPASSSDEDGTNVYDGASSSETATISSESEDESPKKSKRITMRRYRETIVEPLPVFDGSRPELWVSLEVIYRHLKRTGLNDDELTAQISKAVQGPARRHIEDLLLVRAKPKRIMECLRDNYGDPDQVLKNIVKAMERSKPPRSLPKEELLDFAFMLKSLVTTAKAFNRYDFLNHVYLCEKIGDMLRENHKEWWQEQRDRDPDVGLAELSDYLLKKAKFYKMNACPDDDQKKDKRLPEKKDARINQHEASLVRAMKCFHCDESHRLVDCQSFKGLSAKQRFEWIKAKHICSCCLSTPGHFWKDCPYRKECGLKGCKQEHHQLLHFDSFIQKPPSNPPASPVNTHAVVHNQANPTLYKIIPVRIKDAKGDLKPIYAFLDLGSSSTLIERSLYDELGFTGTRSILRMRWTQDVERTESGSFQLTVQLRSMSSEREYTLNDVNTVTNLNLPSQSLDAEGLKSRYQHLKYVPLKSYSNAKPSILIGLKDAKLCVGRRTYQGRDGEPIAMRTPLGWAIFGGHADAKFDATSTEHVMLHEMDPDVDRIHQELRRHFSLDSLGIRTCNASSHSEDERQALRLAKGTLKYTGDRYEIGLLWRNEETSLPNNYPAALRRLQSFERSLIQDVTLLEWVNNHIDEMVRLGYARIATEDDTKSDSSRIWYLPTFVVMNPNKTPLKPRLVFDAAARYGGTSLNDKLWKGPDLVIPLMSGLFKMRERKFVVTGDVKQMYHQVRIRAEDQQAQRFLWRRGDSTATPTTYILQVMAFGTVSSSFCAQFVKNEHSYRYVHLFPRATDSTTKYMYVDDRTDSFDTEEEAVDVTNEVLFLLDEGGFELRGIQSNSKGILSRLPQDRIDQKPTDLTFKDGPENVVKVLGMKWNHITDTLSYGLRESALPEDIWATDCLPTKRQVLSLIMKIFDPLGLVSHILIWGKVLLQELWVSGIGWDERIPVDLTDQWKQWLDLLKGLPQVSLPRWYAPVAPDDATIELHLFADASDKAFAASAYFRISLREEVHVSLVMSKVKVMPVRQISIPQAELTAALMASRLATTVTKLHDFKISNTYFWTDSKVVLAWINSTTRRFKPFVALRIGEILQTTTRSQWRYVPTKENAADDATKLKTNLLDSSSRWYKGPAFLRASQKEWPTASIETSEEAQQFCGLIETVQSPLALDDPLLRNVNAKVTSSWRALVRVVAYRLRFINIKVQHVTPTEKFLTPNDLERAEIYIFRTIQRECYGSEISELNQHGRVTRQSRLYRLSPRMSQDGLVRLDTRLQNASRSYAARNPIVLPSRHSLVEALIWQTHYDFSHQGESAIITFLREKAWITDVRRAVKRVKRQCSLCDYLYSLPKPQLMANLPKFRLADGGKAFTHAGVDACGPFEVTVKRRLEKRWVLMFTCLVSRAIHIEVLESMSADACMIAVNDFVNTRGAVSHMYSDCGANFIGANNVYSNDLRAISDVVARRTAEENKILWHFNPSRTPHWGGCVGALDTDPEELP